MASAKSGATDKTLIRGHFFPLSAMVSVMTNSLITEFSIRSMAGPANTP